MRNKHSIRSENQPTGEVDGDLILGPTATPQLYMTRSPPSPTPDPEPLRHHFHATLRAVGGRRLRPRLHRLRERLPGLPPAVTAHRAHPRRRSLSSERTHICLRPDGTSQTRQARAGQLNVHVDVGWMCAVCVELHSTISSTRCDVCLRTISCYAVMALCAVCAISSSCSTVFALCDVCAASTSSWTPHPFAGVCVVVFSHPALNPHSSPSPGAAAAAEEGGSAPLSAGPGKLSRLRCVHPRRRISASYALAASSLMAKYPAT